MLRARIVVNLPSVEIQRRMGPLEWVRSLFGAQIELGSGYDEVTASAFELLRGIHAAFARAGVTDAVSLLVDKKVVYMDRAGATNDLDALWQAAADKRVLTRPFREIHLVMNIAEAELLTILDLRVTSRVLAQMAEMQLELSSRPVELSVKSGEAAPAYAYRVRAFADDRNRIANHRLSLDALASRIANALRAALPGSNVTTEPAVVRLIRPEGQQLGRFRRLGWGSSVSAPRYRPVPTRQLAGAYHDPFFYYYDDPYYGFTSWLLIDSMLRHGSLDDSNIYVVDPAGQPLFRGNEAAAHRQDAWEGARGVEIAPDGSVQVDPSLPDDGGRGDPFLDGSRLGELGLEGGTSWNESAGLSEAGAPGGDSGSFGTSGSSCSSGSSGSSCSSGSSGSSCGSSCGSSSS